VKSMNRKENLEEFQRLVWEGLTFFGEATAEDLFYYLRKKVSPDKYSIAPLRIAKYLTYLKKKGLVQNRMVNIPRHRPPKHVMMWRIKK